VQDLPAEDTFEGSDRLEAARRVMLEGVGTEIAASFPGITRLGGQIVAALYLSDTARSMDELCEELGRSKSNIFTNLKALDAAGIVERRRGAGMRHDMFALRGPYPDVIIGAYIARLRRVVADYRALTDRALKLMGDAKSQEAETLRARLRELHRKYELFGRLFGLFGTEIDGPLDLEAMLGAMPRAILQRFAEMARSAIGPRSETQESRGRGRDPEHPARAKRMRGG
jgi:HTH-type transcriptional regulator, osmoprotectant uptake regulator